MGLSQPGGGAGGQAPNVIFAESNSPPGGGSGVDWDTFYDTDGSTVLAGGALTAALAAIGLVYTPGGLELFTPIEVGTWDVNLWAVLNEAPPGDSFAVRISHSMYAGDTTFQWDDATFPVDGSGTGSPAVSLGVQVYADPALSGSFRVWVDGGGGTLAPINYAVLTIMRLL